MSNEKHKNLERYFKDKRGRIVKVVEWDPYTNRVYFMYDNYDHRCFVPFSEFEKHFTEVKDYKGWSV
ncbi:MAG: DUF4222 domain-containing protein [Providencia sp.]|uniref:DUF4222 domain-containing protein n=1 Tax=Providencia sp. TaxID=589 RepID=UPI001B407FA0|nr:DUF4222 domain-containing protein [Providencia sp.]